MFELSRTLEKALLLRVLATVAFSRSSRLAFLGIYMPGSREAQKLGLEIEQDQGNRLGSDSRDRQDASGRTRGTKRICLPSSNIIDFRLGQHLEKRGSAATWRSLERSNMIVPWSPRVHFGIRQSVLVRNTVQMKR